MADYTGDVLAVLFNRAHNHDIEFTASAYWQAMMQANFTLRDGYAVLCEQSPDENDRTRIDQIVYRLTPDRLLGQLCLVEGKRRGVGNAHIIEAEDRALRGARKALEHSGQEFVFAMTHWRTQFRVWQLRAGTEELEPMDG
ncbi:hypothetical protein F5144DRAFT_650552, partial [Chaetomium tenue]